MRFGVDALGVTEFGAAPSITILHAVAMTLRYASMPMVTALNDTPPAEPIDDRVRLDDMALTQEVGRDSDGRWSGFPRRFASQIVIEDTDNGMADVLATRVLRGRTIRLKLGQTTRVGMREVAPSLAACDTAFSGRIEGIERADGGGALVLRIAEGESRLDRPIQQNLYTGSGGTEGSGPLSGQPKPLCYGVNRGVAGTQVDPLIGIWQLHDGEIKAATAKVRGVPLQFAGDASSYEEMTSSMQLNVGEYGTCRRQGFARLGGVPDGPLTFDVEGDGLNDGQRPVAGSGLFVGGGGFVPLGSDTYSRYPGGMLFRILRTRADYTAAQLDVDHYQAFDQRWPYELGIVISSSERPTVRDVCTQIADSIGAVLFVARDGKTRLRMLEGPAEGFDFDIGPEAIVGDSGVLEEVLPYEAPWPAITLRYGVIWSPLQDEEVSLELVGEARAAVTTAQRYVTVEDRISRLLLPERPPLVIDGVLNHERDAREVADRLLTRVYSRGRRYYRLSVAGRLLDIELLRTVRVTWPGLGLDAGRQLVVVGCEERPATALTELLLHG